MRAPSIRICMHLMQVILLGALLLQAVSTGWAWKIERPTRTVAVQDRMESAYTDDKASVGLGVAAHNYVSGPDRYGSSDFVSMNISATANSRKGTTYGYRQGNIWWIDELDLYPCQALSLGDNDGDWVDIPRGMKIRFYGGQYSAEYRRVWICSNGFIAFDEEEYERVPTQYLSPTPSEMPNSGPPNGIIAAVWTDLELAADSRIFYGVYEEFAPGGYKYFVIIWKNMKPKLNNERLTFEIILDDAYNYQSLTQSAISISYYSVTAIPSQFSWGIEDQQGCKGLGNLCDGTDLNQFNGKTIFFTQNSSSFCLKEITITLQDTCTQTRFNILEPPDMPLCGFHVLGGEEVAAPAGAFLIALLGTGALLLGPAGYPLAGIILDTALVAIDWGEGISLLAESQYGNRFADVADKDDGKTNWAQACALTEMWCVDASLSIFVDWILDDADNQQHSLTITAQVEYEDRTDVSNPISMPPITTTVNLEIKLDDNNDWSSADVVEKGTYSWLWIDPDHDPADYYKIYVTRGAYITAKMTPPSNANFDLYLYSPNDLNNPKDRSEREGGYSDSVGYIADSAGYWYIRVTAPASGYGFYQLDVDIANSWVSPTGYIDPNAGWSYETRAYDDNEDTYARTATLKKDAWSTFLYLTRPSITCDKIRVLNKYSTSVCYYDIDVFVDSSWVNVYEWTIDSSWTDISFAEGIVTQLRVRVKRLGGTGNYILRLYEADFGMAPKLKTYQISGVSDDCRKHTSAYGDYFYTTGSYILAGTDFYAWQTYFESGMRFIGVDIPLGATIVSAHLKLCAWNSVSGTTVNTRLTGETKGNSATFANLNDYNARARTSAYEDWNAIPPWTTGTWYTSEPDLKDIVQEIVDREDWQSGNALSLFWADHGSFRSPYPYYCYRTATAYDYSPVNAPKLEITFFQPG